MDDTFLKEKQKFFRSIDDSVVNLLLKDKSTGKNIIWATDNYSKLGEGYQMRDEMTLLAVKGRKDQRVEPRALKNKTIKAKRIKKNGEVFTSPWICNHQNNLVDNEWFGRNEVFNKETDSGWETSKEKIEFPEGRTWKDYVDSKRLEITCGEAPYLVSLYDSVNGTYIPLEERIGILDRKLRIVNENASSDEEWEKWVIRAFQATFGYEFQGDSLLLARENEFYTYVENYRKKYGQDPSIRDMKIIANIIVWNLFQMDGLKGVVPFSCEPEINGGDEQLSLFSNTESNSDTTDTKCPGCKNDTYTGHVGIYCKLQNWRDKSPTYFVDCIQKGDAK